MKVLVSLVAVLLVGCASQAPANSTFDRSDMTNFETNCARAKQQVDYLQTRIDAYHAYFQTHIITLEDRRYYSKLKNNIWSLRSSCSALQ